MSTAFTCTACAVTFDDSEDHKSHYKLDWHRYNLRRKLAGLAPVDQSNFDRRLAAALGPSMPKPKFEGRCKECRKNFRSEGLYNQHLQSKKHRDAVKTASNKAAIAVVETPSSDSPSPMETADSAPNSTPSHTAGGGESVKVASVAPGDEDSADSMLADASGLLSKTKPGEGFGDEEQVAPPRMGQKVCVFCDVESSTFEDNCAHMLQGHGFFVPDVEYLSDPQGLLGYVEEKVKLGHICLYCNGKGKTFHTYRALQQHMMDRSHCKLLYEEGEDLHEYEAFYDFSSSYTEAEQRGLVEASSTATAAKDDENPSDVTGMEIEGESVEFSRTLGVTNLGELILFDGKTVGNRQWNRYYRQRLKTPDESEFAAAQRRATRLQLGALYDEEVKKGTSTGGAVSLQRGQRRAFGGLPGVTCPKDVKMLRAHQRIEARQRLKTGLRQNKLNKTFDRVTDM